MDRLKESPFTGMFILPSGKEVPGILNLAGIRKASLKYGMKTKNPVQMMDFGLL